MTLGTIIRYQFGGRQAIETVARSRASFLTGIILVVLTAIPRNYDQKFVTESRMWLFGPLLFSIFSGTILFEILFLGFIKRRLASPESVSTFANWRSFMGLFWMTAPVAWLYAIPVEGFLDSYQAAQVNLTMLGLVALWRVLLMARVIAVLQEMRFSHALLWVLLPASLEVLVIAYVGGMLSPGVGQRIIAGMSGMINSPESGLIFQAMKNALTGALVMLGVVVVLLIGVERDKIARPFPELTKDRLPGWWLTAFAAIWIGIAIPPQMKQHRFVTHAKLVEAGRHREALNYLERFDRKDFPASRRIGPDPYDHKVWEELPGLVGELKPTDANWVRGLYLEDIRVMFTHRWLRCSPEDLVGMFEALEHLPEAKEWMAQNRALLPKAKSLMDSRSYSKDGPIPGTGKLVEQLRGIFERLGVDYEKLSDK